MNPIQQWGFYADASRRDIDTQWYDLVQGSDYIEETSECLSFMASH